MTDAPKKQVKMVRQIGNTCGQACVAMLAGIPLADAMGFCRKIAETDGADLIRGLRKAGLKTSATTIVIQNDKPLPEVAILRFRTPKAPTGLSSWGGHWVLKVGDEIFDPMEENPMPQADWMKKQEVMMSIGAKISGYIEVQWKP